MKIKKINAYCEVANQLGRECGLDYETSLKVIYYLKGEGYLNSDVIINDYTSDGEYQHEDAI